MKTFENLDEFQLHPDNMEVLSGGTGNGQSGCCGTATEFKGYSGWADILINMATDTRGDWKDENCC